MQDALDPPDRVWDTAAIIFLSEDSDLTLGGHMVMASADNMFANELALFEKEKERLIKEAEGQYVVIKGDEILGIFTDQRRAIDAGYQKYGNVPFLVKQIAMFEAPVNFVSNTLGFSNADVQCTGH